MKHPLIAAAAAMLVASAPLVSHAAAVHAHYQLISGNTWYADFTVTNDGSPAEISGFTVYFDEGVFQSLSLLASPANWDSIIIQPDPGLSADGFLDSIGSVPLTLGQSQGGFRVQFNHLGNGVPRALSFDINDANFNVLFSGATTVSAVPEPSSILLAAMAVLAAARVQRGHRRTTPKASRATALA